jgi:hypothetical protein
MVHKQQLVGADNLVYKDRNCSVNACIWAERPGFDTIHNSGVRNVSLNHNISKVSGLTQFPGYRELIPRK